MSRVPWKEGKVVSVETRPGLFVLGQMVRQFYMLFFDSFRDSPDWPDMALEELPQLHVAGVVGPFISRGNVKHQKHLKPIEFAFPNVWIDTDSEVVFRTVWTGSPHEMTVAYMGSKASLVDRGMAIDPKGATRPRRILKRTIDPQDAATIDAYELTNLVAPPYQNERLYLCYLLGRNVDVHKDLVFRRELPIEYETFLRYLAVPDDRIDDIDPEEHHIDPKIPKGRKPYSELKQRKKK